MGSSLGKAYCEFFGQRYLLGRPKQLNICNRLFKIRSCCIGNRAIAYVFESAICLDQVLHSKLTALIGTVTRRRQSVGRVPTYDCDYSCNEKRDDKVRGHECRIEFDLQLNWPSASQTPPLCQCSPASAA